MVSFAQSIPVPFNLPALREMFEARKRVFVDLLKWDIPVLEERYEVDQFDDEDATYLIVPDGRGGHAGSARLLKTTQPHILDTLFPELCAAPPPRGPRVLEITHAPPPLVANDLDMRDGHPADYPPVPQARFSRLGANWRPVSIDRGCGSSSAWEIARPARAGTRRLWAAWCRDLTQAE